MAKNKLLFVAGVIVFVVLLYFSYINFRNYNRILDINTSRSKTVISKDRTIACLKQNYFYSNRHIADSVFGLVDFNGKVKNIRDITADNDSAFLLCKISEQYCSACNDYAVNIAKDFGYTNTIYLTNCVSKRTLQNLSNTYNIDESLIYETEMEISDADFILVPYFIFIDKSHRISSIYIPFEANDESDKEMLALILDKINKTPSASNQ